MCGDAAMNFITCDWHTLGFPFDKSRMSLLGQPAALQCWTAETLHILIRKGV